VNVLGFRRLLAAAAEAGVRRVVWTSSTVVYGPAEGHVARVDEDAPRRPAGVYGLTKTLAEEVAAFTRRRHGLEIAGLRIPLMLGPGLWYDGAASPVKRLVAEARPGARPVVEAPAAPFDAMHVADAGRLVETLLASPAPRHDLYNVAGFTTSFAEIAATLRRLVPGYEPDLREAAPAVTVPLVSDARLLAETGFAVAHDIGAVLRDMLVERDAGGRP
jgi:UDP-glucose 4-epimerase